MQPQIKWTKSLIAILNEMNIGDAVVVEGGRIECCEQDRNICNNCVVDKTGLCHRVYCTFPNRIYKFVPKDNLGNLQGIDKEHDIIDHMNISYKRERFAFLSLTFTIGALGAIIMLTIIDLIRYAITLGVK